MNLEQLKDKALSLPFSPGVYLMKDKNDVIIYIGKAKRLKNRVSQYFQDTAGHTLKTRLMVSKIAYFDVIVCASEFDALVLECSLIKRHQPKYNILLKDDKGYPYLRLDLQESYPMISMVSRVADDGANYFGPFGSRGVTSNILEAVCAALKLPQCGKNFPRDIGKSRPCLNYHMNQCAAWCQTGKSVADYRIVIEQAKQLLSGKYRSVSNQIYEQMIAASEELNFELASNLRDRMKAVEALGKKQLVTAAFKADMDVVGYAQSESKTCFSVLHYRSGNLLDKDYELLPLTDDEETTVASLVKQYYLNRGYAPKLILLPFEIEDRILFEQLLEQRFNKKTRIRIPQRGDNAQLVALAIKNAQEEINRSTDRDERINGTLSLLGKMVGIQPPKRIESFDISNISGTDTVASMVVFLDGRSRRSEYKHFKIEDLTQQDDYASMAQVIRRRFVHYLHGDKGFDCPPDLLLIDGGAAHAKVAENVLAELDLYFPVFGMVKDGRHRTRALVNSQGSEIQIDVQQSVFSLVGSIQEETHRFAITYHRKLRSSRLMYSELDTIPGIGPKRKQTLLKAFKSLNAIRTASIAELEQYLPRNVALTVYSHYNDLGKG